MRISENQVDEFITLYKEEYNVELERTDALEQINALINLVSRMLPHTELLEENKEILYTINATNKVL